MKAFWTLFLSSIAVVVGAQSVDSLDFDEQIIDFIEIAPSFPGGKEALDNYLKENFNWTQEKVKVEGTVFVEFWIKEDGRIDKAKVVRGLCETCDKEALRLVSEMPVWSPAQQNGKPVPIRLVLPVRFNL